MTEEQKEHALFLAECYIGDKEIAYQWFHSFNKKLGCPPSEATYSAVVAYLEMFVFGR